MLCCNVSDEKVEVDCEVTFVSDAAHDLFSRILPGFIERKTRSENLLNLARTFVVSHVT
jgi:hypothetical protein